MTTRRAVLLVMAGIVSVQVGAAIAKHMFDRVDPSALVWLRLAFSALIFVALARPRLTELTGRSRQDWHVVLGFAASLATMNWAIYQAFARIPLGIAVMIEFAGPLLVAVLSSRRPRDFAWIGLAGVGVVLLGLEPGRVTLVGVLFALLAGAAWGSYILLSASTGRRWPGLDGLTIASVLAALALAPLALSIDPGVLWRPEVLAVGLFIGLFSSVVPYACELKALRHLSPGIFGVLMSMEPAAAALAALVVLQESLTLLQWLAIGCVIAASVGATSSGAGAEGAAISPADR